MKNQNKRFFALGLMVFLVSFGQLALAQNDVYLASYNGQREIRAKNSVTLGDGFHIQAPIRPVRIYTSPTFINCITLNAAPSPSQNYILSRVFKLPGVNESNITASRNVCEENVSIQYIDGLGRPSQTVIVQGSPSFADIVQPMEYDALGRVPKTYLPYAVAGNNGAFKLDALYASVGQQAFYNAPPPNVATNTIPYSQISFSDDPRNRVLTETVAGSDYFHGIKTDYNYNNDVIIVSDPDYRRVKHYKANSAINQQTALVDNGWYGNSELSLVIKKDENWQVANGRAGTIENYTDKAGRLVLNRVWENENTPLSTYYVYDKFGNLSFVLPPKAEPDQAGAVTQSVLNGLCYQYLYDQYNRLVEKKLPGAGPVYLIYNKSDQLVMTQDAVQRNKTPQEWNFSKYDALGRTILTGIYQHSGSIQNGDVNGADNANRISLQTDFTNQPYPWEKKDNSAIGYSNVSLPTNNIAAYLSINYYDNYNIPGLPALYDDRNNHSKQTDGLLTAQKIAVLNDPTKMLLTISYYDSKGQIEKVYAQHFKGGTIDENNYDEITNTYSFVGELMSSTRRHMVGAATTTIVDRYEYDHMGRNLANFLEINGQGGIVTNKISYNEIGQVVKIGQYSNDGTNFLNETEYAYNSRGWLNKSESPLFKFSLKYNEGGQPQYNGNVSSFNWGNNLEKTFSYEYDKLNRLTSGFTSNMVENGITYDKMGNIKTLSRDGQTISYNYAMNGLDGNQLQSVAGNGLNTQTFVYDLNGNTVTDGSKNNIQIGYNLLNLPQSVNGSQSIAYTYNALGTMLNKQSATTGATEFINGIQYVNGNLDFIKIDGGRAVRQLDNTYRYEFDIIDHLGNVRLSFDKDPITGSARRIQEDEYYPFGKRKSVAPVSVSNKYLYNGKEIQDELGEYDYGARFYDPEIARWSVQDPKASEGFRHSPYSYAFNNPVNFIDPDGMWPQNFPMSLGLGLYYGTNGFIANVNLITTVDVGNWQGSYGLGVSYYSNYYTTGKSGTEIRNSFMTGGPENGGTNFDLGTNIWTGFGGLKEFNQRTGILSFSSGNFGFSYENDGTPFQYIGLGDGNDSYRSAAASIRYKDASLNMNLFTGRRNKEDSELEKKMTGGEMGVPEGYGQFGEYYKHGFVNEQGPQYRYGGLTLNYKGLSFGVNSEWVRHAFQNIFAHGIVQNQRQFEMMSNDWKPIMQGTSKSRNKFTIWAN